MILPNIRSSFGREEVEALLDALGSGDPGKREHWESVLTREGIDALLDHPLTLRRMVEQEGLQPVPPALLLYVFIRRSFLEAGIESRSMADYVTAVVAEFGRGGRSRRVASEDTRTYDYLVDILADLNEARGRRAFLLQAHLGNFALWLSGLFPDHIVAKVRRKGGPGLDYYEEMGRTGYRMAARTLHARKESLDELYRDTADQFGRLRRSLNRVSDRFFFPDPSDPVERLLRQARSDFRGPPALG